MTTRTKGWLCTLLILLMLLTSGGILAADWNDDWDNDWGSTASEDGTGGEALMLSGYLETTGLAILPRKPDVQDAHLGLRSILRLRGRAEPAAFLSVTAEGELQDLRGAANPRTRAGILGLPDATTVAATPASMWYGLDENSSFRIDYLYGSAAFGPVDIRVGRQPLAWGTAYAFNPTELTNPRGIGGLAGLEPPGISAITVGITPGRLWGVEGYIAFEDRSRSSTALPDLSLIEKLPYGARIRLFPGLWDFGAGVARSADYTPHPGSDGQIRNNDYAVAEFAGSLGVVLLYGETAIEIGSKDWSATRSIDAAAGLQWDPWESITLQGEYHRRGRGSKEPDDYSLADRLAGSLVGRDYAVGIASWSTLDDDLRLRMATLVNLNDRSLVLIPELRYLVVDDFHLELGASVFHGDSNTEFNGRISDDALGKLDLGRSQLYLRTTWYF